MALYFAVGRYAHQNAMLIGELGVQDVLFGLYSKQSTKCTKTDYKINGVAKKARQ